MPTTARADIRAFAPGRVNLIGEHTDYNGGLALPFAIALGVRVSCRPGNEPGVGTARAIDLDEADRFDLTDPRPASGWRGFVRGTVAELARTGTPLGSLDLEFTGDVPPGAGLSSSAALGVSLALALSALAGPGRPSDLELARLCSRVEHDWVGAQSGLLDQLASICSRPGHALLIDFGDGSLEPVPLVLGEHRLIAVDSGERHATHSSGYNDRRRECRAAGAALGIDTLREADRGAAERLAEPLRSRVLHVIGENERVLETVAALERGDLTEVGHLLDASHASLRDLYEVSTPRVEATVAALHAHGALGARLVGGGFGGSVIALLPPGCPPPPGALPLEAGAGARLLSGPAGGCDRG